MLGRKLRNPSCLYAKHWIGKNQQALRALLGEPFEGLLTMLRIAHIRHDQLQTEGACRTIRVIPVHPEHMIRLGITENGRD